jgi:hypothetical protein
VSELRDGDAPGGSCRMIGLFSNCLANPRIVPFDGFCAADIILSLVDWSLTAETAADRTRSSLAAATAVLCTSGLLAKFTIFLRVSGFLTVSKSERAAEKEALPSGRLRYVGSAEPIETFRGFPAGGGGGIDSLFDENMAPVCT